MGAKINRVGVLGQGIIGSRVAENLRRAGFEATTWSRTGREGAGAVKSLAEVAEAARVIQIFVRDDAALGEAMEGLSANLTSGHIVLNHATVSPGATRAAAAVCEKAGAGFLDAPFTGSKNAAANGKLVYYIGGDEKLLEAVRPVLEASSTKILPLGGIGEATVLKIVTNLVTAATVEALAEALAITRTQGVAPLRLLEALEANANYSTLVGMKLPTMIGGDFEPHFSVTNMLKDMNFAGALAREAALKTPVLDGTAAVLAQALAAGKGDRDFSAVAEDTASRAC